MEASFPSKALAKFTQIRSSGNSFPTCGTAEWNSLDCQLSAIKQRLGHFVVYTTEIPNRGLVDSGSGSS